MDRDRVEIIKRMLQAHSLDALLLRLPENIVMACGAWPLNGAGLAIFTLEDGPKTLIVPESERHEVDSFWGKEIKYYTTPLLGPLDVWQEVAMMLQETLHALPAGASVGYEDALTVMVPAHNAAEVSIPRRAEIDRIAALVPQIRFRAADELLQSARAKKTTAEVRRLRTANEIASFGLAEFSKTPLLGLSEAEIAAKIFASCLSQGVEQPGVHAINVYPQVSAGRNSARGWRSIVQTGATRLRDGDLALLELAVCVDGYWADVTRVRATGVATDQQHQAFDAVMRAQAVAIAAIRHGVSAPAVHQLATETLRESGFSDEIRHLTGHGLGFSYHEPIPMLWSGAESRLETGHVCSVEPGLYSRAWGGIRIEDNIVVTTDGCEVLTFAPKTLL
jgi:Xaa-Pro dipeptidase